jgi:RNA polymerase sigma factor (sigma-70 family)
MLAQPPTSEAHDPLIQRLLPSTNPDPHDRARAWADWHASPGPETVRKFIRASNNTLEADDDLLQDTLVTAYVEVERGRYAPRCNVPFTAYVKGIARNKIREARRRHRPCDDVNDDLLPLPAGVSPRQLETWFERHEQYQALQHGLRQLPAARRQILESYLNGKSLAEIAVDLQMNEALVRQHKHRGLRRLQQLILG